MFNSCDIITFVATVKPAEAKRFYQEVLVNKVDYSVSVKIGVRGGRPEWH
jgi:hypothetical protein